MKKHIPNLFTCFNLFSGCIGCVMAFNGEYFWVVFFVILGSIFDFFDGFLARLLNAPSAIGKELDSLADVITFGMAPALILFHYLSNNINEGSVLYPVHNILPYFAFILVAFSALRLAKFNIDTRQTTSFIGLPTPPNGLFWISFCYGLNERFENNDIIIFLSLLLVIIFSLLMVSEIPMFSLKIKSIGFKENKKLYLLLVIAILSVIFFQIFGIAVTMLFYIAIALISYKKPKNEQI